jgi:hypothetical protein
VDYARYEGRMRRGGTSEPCENWGAHPVDCIRQARPPSFCSVISQATMCMLTHFWVCCVFLHGPLGLCALICLYASAWVSLSSHTCAGAWQRTARLMCTPCALRGASGPRLFETVVFLPARAHAGAGQPAAGDQVPGAAAAVRRPRHGREARAQARGERGMLACTLWRMGGGGVYTRALNEGVSSGVI